MSHKPQTKSSTWSSPHESEPNPWFLQFPREPPPHMSFRAERPGLFLRTVFGRRVAQGEISPLS